MKKKIKSSAKAKAKAKAKARANAPQSSNSEPLELSFEWLEPLSEQPGPEVVRLIVDEDLWDPDNPSKQDQEAFIKQVSEFVQKEAPKVSLICAPGGTVTARLQAPPAMTAAGMNGAITELQQHLGKVSGNSGSADWLLGVDGIAGGESVVQTMMWIPASTTKGTPPVAVKVYPAPGEQGYLLGWHLACLSTNVSGVRGPFGAHQTIALSCHEAISFSNRALSRLVKTTVRGKIAGWLKKAVLQGATAGFTVVGTHLLRPTSSHVFNSGLRNLHGKYGQNALLASFAPRRDLRAVAKRYPVVGNKSDRVATLLVRVK